MESNKARRATGECGCGRQHRQCANSHPGTWERTAILCIASSPSRHRYQDARQLGHMQRGLPSRCINRQEPWRDIHRRHVSVRVRVRVRGSCAKPTGCDSLATKHIVYHVALTRGAYEELQGPSSGQKNSRSSPAGRLAPRVPRLNQSSAGLHCRVAASSGSDAVRQQRGWVCHVGKQLLRAQEKLGRAVQRE